MIRKGLRNNRAVTLTELLVVLAIIALLATIAVPVYINQMQRARVAAAQMETRQIAEAMQQCAITHGFLVPIHILDNIPNRDTTNTGSTASLDDFDNIVNKTNRRLIDVTRPLSAQGGVGNQLNLGSTDTRVDRLIEGWQGPFLNPRRVRYVGENVSTGNTGDLTEDLVIDPWGNPYRVYSDVGLLGSDGIPTQNNQTVTLGMDDLLLPSGSGDEPSRFDRFAIVSYGPDGLSGFTLAGGSNPLTQGDDISYTFSITPGNESKYQFF